ncbi:hypothetical protein [Fibrobacter succinogenes]|uniref:hypothetical protein n=1 Tax=Fibrobacter succinogenes TaxID=833 RepID=UPI0015682ACB|nr:hypothetical protein [Fibrobacter succinogenes]
MLTIKCIITPMHFRPCEQLNSNISNACNNTPNSATPPDSTKDIVAFLTLQPNTIDTPLPHVQAIVNERGRIVNVITNFHIWQEFLRK